MSGVAAFVSPKETAWIQMEGAVREIEGSFKPSLSKKLERYFLYWIIFHMITGREASNIKMRRQL
jgi:hypothetical protein